MPDLSLVLWGHSEALISLFLLIGYSAHRGAGAQGLAEQFKFVFLSLSTHAPSLSPTYAFFLSHQHCVRYNLYCENNILIEYIFKATHAFSDTAPYQSFFFHPPENHGFKGPISDEFPHASVSYRGYIAPS